MAMSEKAKSVLETRRMLVVVGRQGRRRGIGGVDWSRWRSHPFIFPNGELVFLRQEHVSNWELEGEERMSGLNVLPPSPGGPLPSGILGLFMAEKIMLAVVCVM